MMPLSWSTSIILSIIVIIFFLSIPSNGSDVTFVPRATARTNSYFPRKIPETSDKSSKYHLHRKFSTETFMSSSYPLYEEYHSQVSAKSNKILIFGEHIEVQYFAIQDWKDAGDLEMHFIPGVINPADDLTKPLGWVLHARHARRFMGHYQ